MTDIFAGVGTLEHSLDYHLDRHIMLSANIANVDTPGYRAIDLGLVPATGPREGEITLARTDPRHIDPSVRPAMLVPFEDPSESPGNDQNAVDMDRELAKVGANTLRYEAASELIARRLGMLRYAAGDALNG